MTQRPQDTSAEDPDGVNPHIRFREWPRQGDRPGLLHKIVIINQHTNNYGDDIAGSAMLGELVRRFPQARIEVFYSWNLSQGQLPFNHPQVTPHYICPACATGLCELCAKFLDSHHIATCPRCGEFCKIYEEVKARADNIALAVDVT